MLLITSRQDMEPAQDQKRKDEKGACVCVCVLCGVIQ